MRCHDARPLVDAQREGDLTLADDTQLQEHLQQCPSCRAYQQRQDYLATALPRYTTHVCPTISTARIMFAVQHRQRITQQVETLQQQQRSRVVRLRFVWSSLLILLLSALGGIPLLFIILALVQPTLLVQMLSALSDVAAVLMTLLPYLQAGLTLVAQNNWLLASVALVLVIMMVMWLRLMRYPQEV